MPKPLWSLVLLQSVVMLASVGLGALLAGLGRSRPPLERMIVSAMPVLIAMLGWHWVVSIGILPPGGPWSAIRLAPSMALRLGEQLYQTRDVRGPILGWIYPPVAPLAYLPATLFHEPGAAVIAARCLNLVYYYAPAAWLILSSRTLPGPQGRWIRLLILCTFALITSQSRGLSYCSTEVHADASALALGAASLGLLGRSTPRSGWAPRVGAVILAALAVWAKQLTAPVFAALPLWILIREGFGPAIRFAGVWIAGGLLVTLAIIAAFPPEALFYNILSIPAHHPWITTHPVGIGRVAVTMQTEHLVLLLLISAGLLIHHATRAEPLGGADEAEAPEAWPLFLLVGLLASPIAVLGMIKVGGFDNNLSYSLYYLAIGCMLLLADVAGRERASEQSEGVPKVPLMVLGTGLLLALIGTERIALELANGIFPGRDARDAVRYLRAHPGEAYFPWHPLEHMMVEGRATHSESGVGDRKMAREPITFEQFLRNVPADARRICYPDGLDLSEQLSLEYAGGSWRRRAVAELPGWVCFEREDGGPVFRGRR